MQIIITPSAQTFLNQMLTKQKNACGIRFSVNHSGCSGLSYVLEAIEKENAEDSTFSLADNLTLFVDKNSLPYIEGTVIDCVTEGLNKKIIFNNPQAQNTCGCGESFAV